MSVVWAASWLCLGASGLVHGTWGASVLVAACASVFALGETFLQPTVPAITNDLTTDRLRGRTNAIGSLCFQSPMVIAPPVAGWLIDNDLGAAYIVILVVGCAAVAYLALARLEPQVFITKHFLAFAARLERERKISGLGFLQVELGADRRATFQFIEGVAKTSLAGNAAERLGVTRDQLDSLVERNTQRFRAATPPAAGAWPGTGSGAR